MKKLSLQLFLPITITLFLYACGGVIGNIEKYPFPNISEDSLRAALNRVYAKYPQLQKTDTSMYGVNDGKDFYFVLDYEGKRFVFDCNVIVYAPRDIDLSLTTATTWGSVMELAPNMGFSEKRKYRKLFEEFILPKIKNQINK